MKETLRTTPTVTSGAPVPAPTPSFRAAPRSRRKSACLLALSCVAAAVAVGALGGCDQAPSADGLPEWKATDHHSADDNAGGASGAQAAPTGRAGSGGAAGGANDVQQLVDLAWRSQCTQCHGPTGRGDGQMGAMLKARDLTDPDWQSKVSDADIAAGIKNGKNKMPKYDLPDPVVAGLVARIRQLKGG